MAQRGGRPRTRTLLIVAVATLLLATMVPVNVSPVSAAEPTPTLDITWTRPGVAGTLAPPAAVRVGDTVSIGIDTSEYDYAGCEIQFRHAGDQREMWSFFRPTSVASAPDCVPWTFTLPSAPPGVVEVRGIVDGFPTNGNGEVRLMTPGVDLTLQAGGTPGPYTSNFPVPSWATIDTVGDDTPSFNTALTIRKPPGATRCDYTLNGNLQVQINARPPSTDPCVDWSVTLPDIRPAISVSGPFAAPWDGYLIVRGSSIDLFPGADVGGISMTKQMFWDGTGEEDFASNIPAVMLVESRTPHYVLTGSTVVLDPEVRSVTGDGVCQYQMIGPTTTDDGIIEQRPFVDGVCEPWSFDASVVGNYQVGVTIRTDDWIGSGIAFGIWALDPMPAPTIEVEPPVAGLPFDVTSSVNGGEPAMYEFSLGGSTASAHEADSLAVTDAVTSGALAAAGTCTSGTLDYEEDERTAFGHCTAETAGAFTLTARFQDITGATRTRTTTVYVLPPGAAGDIAGHQFETDIRWLYAVGLSGGCSSTAFCPNLAVSREQMASFLVRALDLPAPTRDFFTDDETSIHEADINRLASSKITGGCGGTRFCPQSSITREQMASFLARALNLPPATRDYFSDDNTSVHEADINRLAAAGVTGGCSANTFCPRAAVSRGQMAAFLRRALSP